MKIANRVIEDILKVASEVIKKAFNDKLDSIGFDNVVATDALTEVNGDAIIIFEDEDGDELDVLFTYDEEEGALAIVLDDNAEMEDDEEDGEVDVIELEALDPVTVETNGETAIDLTNLSWLTGNALEAILTVGDIIDVKDERLVTVIRGGKKVRLPVVRRKRKKRLTSKQKAGIKKGVRKRKGKKGQIARKRKKSLALRKRSGLKGVKNKRLRVRG